MPKHTSHSSTQNPTSGSSPSQSTHGNTSDASNSSPQDPAQNPSSPFYIHPSESPSTVIVSPVLTGSNYHSWSRSFKMALVSKNKMGFLNGSIIAPAATDPLHPAWERCNTLIMSWLLNSVSQSIAQSVIYLDHASEIWKDLQERFSQCDLLHIAELQEEVYALKQGSLSITDYFTNLKSLWEELDNYRPLIQCNCPAKTYHHQDFIIRFLKGLDERFSVVRSQVLLMDPLPSVNRIFSMVIQHERQLLSSVGLPDDHQVLFNSTETRRLPTGRGRGSGGRGTSQKICTYCGRSGHTIEICYAKHGYPPGHPRYPGRPRFHDRNSSNASVNNTIGAPRQHGEEEAPIDASQQAGFHLSSAQYQSLLALLQPAAASGPVDIPQSSHANVTQVVGPCNPVSDGPMLGKHFCSHVSSLQHVHHSAHTDFLVSHSSPWILDSGATDHITSSLKWFENYAQIEPITIKLPNGSSVLSKYSGTVCFSPSLVIHNVLYVPNFTFNLISISKLITFFPCKLKFYNNLCEIRDLNSLKMLVCLD